MKMNGNRKKIWIRAGVIAAVLLIAAGWAAWNLFHDADVLEIEDGRVKGASETWLIGRTADGAEPRYVKLGDVSAPKGYVKDKEAADPDGDAVTGFFVFKGKDPEKNPGVILVEPLEGSLEEATAGEDTSLCGACELEGKTGCLVKSEADGELRFFAESPYPDACVRITVRMPEGTDEDDAMALMTLAAAKYTPGKKLSSLAADFKLNFLDDSRWQYLWQGLLVTLEITLAAVILGIIIGVLVAIVRSTWDQNRDRMRPGPGKTAMSVLNGICKVYLTVIRGTPVVIQLMIMYYIIFASARNGVVIAMLAFGINSGAYVAEIIRGGIMAVDHGQLEAGRSLGFNYVQTMRYIIVPQAMKSVLPALANEFIVLLKETSVSGYVAVKDLTKGGDIIRGVTYSAFMPLLAVAAIYLVLVMFFTWLVAKLERRLRSSDH